jgi:small subunit ribosomal protein S14
MAKKCQLHREKVRRATTERHAAKRAELKKKIIDPNIDEEERRDAMFALSKMPRDGARVRHTNRCQRTGVSRAVYRKFQLNRISFRDMALEGTLPGVTKASW